MAEIEPVVEPDCITDDIGRKAVSFVSIHPKIVPMSETLLGDTVFLSTSSQALQTSVS